MGCPNLAVMGLPKCVAQGETYSPSVYQFREFCTRKNHRMCPFFRGFHMLVHTCGASITCAGAQRRA